jgi:hypothetical protein
LIRISQECVGIIFDLLLFESFKKGSVGGYKVKNLGDVLIHKVSKRVSESVDLNIHGVKVAERDFRVKFGSFSHVGEFS